MRLLDAAMLPAIKRLCIGVISKSQNSRLKTQDLSSAMFCILCFASCIFCIAFSTAAEQPMEQTQDEQPLDDGSQYRASPEVQSYAALCKTIYWENMGDYQEAKKQLVAAIQLDPESSLLYTKLAEVLIVLKDYDGAVSTCEKSLVLDPHNADAHYLLGVLNFARQDQQGAVNEFKTVVELNPEHIGAQSRLAAIPTT